MPPNDATETAHALSDFKPFSKFPNCIKFMIWEEFYSQPRYFMTYPVYRGRSRKDEFEVPLGWALRPKGPQTSYQKTIDTQIDQLSSFVASHVRPKFTIEIPLKTTDDGQPHKPAKCCSKRKSRAAHVNINWNFDFIHVKMAIHEVSQNLIPQAEWFRNIRNMVLDHDHIQSYAFGDITTVRIPSVAFCLWEMKDLLGSLRNLALQKVQWHRKRVFDTPLLCFQIRYLLREAPLKPPQWKDLRVSVVSRSPWLDIERHGGLEDVQWKHFIENARPGNERWANARRDVFTGDEITDTRVVFSNLLSPSSLMSTNLPAPSLHGHYPMLLELQFWNNYNELVGQAFRLSS